VDSTDFDKSILHHVPSIFYRQRCGRIPLVVSFRIVSKGCFIVHTDKTNKKLLKWFTKNILFKKIKFDFSAWVWMRQLLSAAEVQWLTASCTLCPMQLSCSLSVNEFKFWLRSSLLAWASALCNFADGLLSRILHDTLLANYLLLLRLLGLNCFCIASAAWIYLYFYTYSCCCCGDECARIDPRAQCPIAW